MDTPLVSVVIPTRDRAEMLRGAVEAVLAQRYPELELIVVDDGSRDHTPSVTAGLGSGAGILVLRHAEPRGPAAARNAGAALAHGELLLFEDDDCRGTPGRVEKLVEALASRPDAAYAFCHSRRVTSAGETVRKGTEGPWSIGTPAALIRADAFREVGGFDEALPRLQDFDLWTRLLARWPAVEVPETLYEAGWDDVGISASDDKLRAAEERLYDKYSPDDLPARDRPARHLSAMHRRLGGKLLMYGHWRRGLAHFRRAVRRCPACPRSWAALAAGLTGPTAYRAIVDSMKPRTAGGPP